MEIITKEIAKKVIESQANIVKEKYLNQHMYNIYSKDELKEIVEDIILSVDCIADRITDSIESGEASLANDIDIAEIQHMRSEALSELLQLI